MLDSQQPGSYTAQSNNGRVISAEFIVKLSEHGDIMNGDESWRE